MKNRPKVTVFYIATGKYLSMWDDFFLSFKKYFLPESDRKIILFTDQPETIKTDSIVNPVKIKSYSWPYITLLRFHIFMEHFELWKDSDYVLFLNANYLFKKKISTNILPSSGLFAGQHSTYWNKTPDKFPYERNPKSTAYVPHGKGKHYFQGAINGGTSQAFAEMCNELIKRIDEDLKNEIIAIWHDESHLNCYLTQHKVKLLHRYYLWPEERYRWYRKPFVTAILRDKRKMGGHAYMRGLK